MIRIDKRRPTTPGTAYVSLLIHPEQKVIEATECRVGTDGTHQAYEPETECHDCGCYTGGNFYDLSDFMVTAPADTPTGNWCRFFIILMEPRTQSGTEGVNEV